MRIRRGIVAPHGRIRRAFVLALAIAGVMGLCGEARAQAGGWWNARWQARREMKAVVPEGVEADEPTAVVEFLTHGRLKPDGSDVRVISRGEEAPCRVLGVGPGDRVRVAFQIGVRSDAYQVYYGNPQAQPPAYNWEIRAGVLMEVRAYDGGQLNDLAQARAAWDRSKDVLGVTFVPNIFMGYNPFGESTGLMAHYTAWLRIDKPGVYTFATVSNNGSFLLIDGKEIVSWPGRHGAWPVARRQAEATLRSGRNRLEYYHVVPAGDPVAVAAWQPPGTDKPVVIPPSAFLPVARATVQPAQTLNVQITPDFDFRQYEAFLDPTANTFVHRFAFRDITEGVNRPYYRPLWDFGDGTTATVWSPEHVYLDRGIFPVTLTLKGPLGTLVTTCRVAVERDWSQQASLDNIEPLLKYYDLVAAYDFAKMPARSLHTACEMFERLEKYDDLLRVGGVLLARDTGVADAVRLEEAERIGRVLIERKRDAAAAVTLYFESEKRAGSDEVKSQLLLHAGDAAVRELGDVARAEGCYSRVMGFARSIRPETRRHALMGLAEVAVLKSDGRTARAQLEATAAIRIERPQQGGAAVRVGSLSRAVEDYIRRDEFADATALLDAWEWEYPLDRLAGYSTLLRAKLSVKRGEVDRAIRLLTSLVAVNPASGYAAEALMIAADCRLRKGDKTGARDTYKRVLAEYPESPLVADALKQLEELK